MHVASSTTPRSEPRAPTGALAPAPAASAGQPAMVATPLEPGERWYLVHTQPRSERRAEQHLAAQHFRPFTPHFIKTVRHARQLRTVKAPLFPRYVFVALDLERDRWLSVRSTFGVSSLFTMEGRPVPVPRGVVETLLAATDGAVTRLDDGLAVGDAVEILQGPFSQMVGRLTRLSDNERVQVLLDLMGGQVPVTLARSALLKVS